MAKITALGEVLIDFSPVTTDSAGYPTMKANPGGAPMNFLAAVVKYGHSGSMIGKVGNDAFGHLLLNTLNDCGIDTTGMVTDDNSFTTLAFVTLDDKGDRRFSFARKPGADTQLKYEEINLPLIENSDVFHFGTLSLTHQPAKNATIKAVELAKEKGLIISYDPNLRLSLWDSADSAKQAILLGMKYADIVKISDEEVDFLWGCGCEEGAEKILSEYGPQLVYVTLGRNGCYYATKEHKGYITNPQGIKPVDTTGAGDIFGGSAMSQMLKTGKKPARLTRNELEAICHYAVCAAALSTEKTGGFTSIPDEASVLRLMRESF
ncbi:MAG: carbohydrate kinase [Oscillospiraceae bacterium]|nr:carbohydrate kinase [Oscillospiraceae bacterium]